MNPTRKQITAVKRTIHMYKALEEKPNWEKCDYFEEAMPFSQPLPIIGDCYLCDEFGCDGGCPLATRRLECTKSKGSPWREWAHADNEYHRKRGADRIVRACRRWLKKHGVEG